jgi:hypothetical protein
LLSFSFFCIFPTLTIEGLVRWPGIFASLAALMFNCVRQDELQDYSPFDDGEACRSRTWLFLSYVVAFVSLAGSAGMLVQDALLPDTPSSWTGIAGVLQCTFVLTRYTVIISLFSCVSAAEEIIDSSKVCTTGNGQMAAVEKFL